MKIRVWEPLLLVAMIAVGWVIYSRYAPTPVPTPTPAQSPPVVVVSSSPSASPVPSRSPDQPAPSASPIQSDLVVAASKSGEVQGIVVIQDGEVFYGATLTMPDESPGLKQTELWRRNEKGWVSEGILGATVGPPPDPKDFPAQWYEINHFPESARKKMATQEWLDLRP